VFDNPQDRLDTALGHLAAAREQLTGVDWATLSAMSCWNC
jgi:hypothetical protein